LSYRPANKDINRATAPQSQYRTGRHFRASLLLKPAMTYLILWTGVSYCGSNVNALCLTTDRDWLSVVQQRDSIIVVGAKRHMHLRHVGFNTGIIVISRMVTHIVLRIQIQTLMPTTGL